MTDERMALLELVEQQADGDLVREMLAFAGGSAKRISYAGLGHPGGADPAGDPEVAQGQLFPQLSRTPADGRKSADGRDPGGLCSGHLDTFGG